MVDADVRLHLNGDERHHSIKDRYLILHKTLNPPVCCVKSFLRMISFDSCFPKSSESRNSLSWPHLYPYVTAPSPQSRLNSLFCSPWVTYYITRCHIRKSKLVWTLCSWWGFLSRFRLESSSGKLWTRLTETCTLKQGRPLRSHSLIMPSIQQSAAYWWTKKTR